MTNGLLSLTSFTGVLLLSAACLFSACAQPAAETRSAAVPSARLLVVGGHEHHDFDRWFNQEDVATLESAGAEASYTDVPGRVLAALETIDVLYLSNNQPLPGQELREAIFNFVGAGKGLMIGHAAGWYGWADWPEYNRDLVAGGTRSHDAYGEFEVVVEDPDHPVMEGVPATFTISDELYRFDKDPEGPSIHVLASAEEVKTGERYPVIWTVHHTNGRIIVNTLGHDGAAHEHPAYRQILQNSYRWAGRLGD